MSKKEMSKKEMLDQTVNEKNIFQMAIFVRLDVHRWWGQAMASKDVIKDDLDKEQVWGIQNLVTDKTLLKEMAGIHQQARFYLNSFSLPFPIEAHFLIPEGFIEEVTAKLKEFQKKYQDLAEAFLDSYDNLQKEFKTNNPKLYRPEKYPSREVLQSRFKFDWVYRQVTPPEGLPQSIQREEMKKFKNEIDQLKEDTKNLIAIEIIRRVSTLTEQFTDGNINNNTINGINDFLDKVDTVFKGFFTQRQLQDLLKEIRECLSGLDSKMIKKDENLRTVLEKELKEVVETIQAIPDLNLTGMKKSRAIDI